MKKCYLSLLLLLTGAESFGAATAASRLSRLPTFNSLGTILPKRSQATLSGYKYTKKGYLDRQSSSNDSQSSSNKGGRPGLPTMIAAALVLYKAGMWIDDKNKEQEIKKQIETIKKSPSFEAIERARKIAKEFSSTGEQREKRGELQAVLEGPHIKYRQLLQEGGVNSGTFLKTALNDLMIANNDNFTSSFVLAPDYRQFLKEFNPSDKNRLLESIKDEKTVLNEKLTKLTTQPRWFGWISTPKQTFTGDEKFAVNKTRRELDILDALESASKH